MKYIHELKKWPKFRWDHAQIEELLASVRHRQGRLMGRMDALGFNLRAEAALQTLTEDVLKSSEIEGEHLEQQQVRSSLARRLGMEVGGLVPSNRNVDGVVEMMLDATQNFHSPLSIDRLYSWHCALFPTGRNGMSKIRVGAWRDDHEGPMQVVSGPMGKTKVHFQAPEAKRLKREIQVFLQWFNSAEAMEPVLKAGLAHLWFVTIHPFDDGNGRIARAITDMALARSEKSPQRFYSMSAQICSEKNAYYTELEAAQKGNLDITAWLEWFLKCLNNAFQGAETILSTVLKKARFWELHSAETFNERQRKMLNRMLDGFNEKLSSSKWARISKCSQDSASRDIEDLLKKKILVKNPSGGRSTSYSLAKIS